MSYSITSQGLVILDGRTLALSPSDGKLFATNVVNRWQTLASKNARGVPLAWVLAIIWAESGGNPNAFRTEPSGQTGVGLMQLTSPALKGGLSDEQLKDPGTNINLGCKFLAAIMKAPPVDLPAVASRYNCGGRGDGSPHTSPTSGQNPSWGLCATAGYLERVSAASNTFLTSAPQASARSPRQSLIKPLALSVLAVLAARRLLR